MYSYYRSSTSSTTWGTPSYYFDQAPEPLFGPQPTWGDPDYHLSNNHTIPRRSHYYPKSQFTHTYSGGSQYHTGGYSYSNPSPFNGLGSYSQHQESVPVVPVGTFGYDPNQTPACQNPGFYHQQPHIQAHPSQVAREREAGVRHAPAANVGGRRNAAGSHFNSHLCDDDSDDSLASYPYITREEKEALSVIDGYLAKFEGMKSAFSPPSRLDFAVSVPPELFEQISQIPPSSEASRSKPRLMITSNNQEVVKYRENLDRLIRELDWFDCKGKDRVRRRLRKITKKVVREVERLERRIEAAWNASARA